ncbi:hypothetical protein BSKO_04262 [Bryopsis sp. KO-2023]|nr:hypothetical protein BSKO_04262 [Bryopsis sp. KO-2023]
MAAQTRTLLAQFFSRGECRSLASRFVGPCRQLTTSCQAGFRQFVPVGDSKPTPESKTQRFRAVTYNILANCYAYEPENLHCPREVLLWESRSPRILAELESYDADIVCLQEVEKNAFEEVFEPKFLSNGYEGLYCSKSPLVPQGFEEGVALFYRTSMFDRIASQSDLFSSNFSKAGTGQFFKAVRTRGDSYIMALLDHKPSGVPLLTCNVHPYAHPKWPDVRMAQMHSLMGCISTFMERQALPKDPKIMIMGDFNSIWRKLETDRYDNIEGRYLVSGVHKLLTEGSVDEYHLHHPFKRNHTGRIASGKIKLRDEVFDSGGLFFESAYMMANGSEPLVTHFTSEVKTCYDYIFMSRDDFSVVETLELPYDTAGIRDPKHVKMLRLPNAKFPSDHLALGATLEFGR